MFSVFLVSSSARKDQAGRIILFATLMNQPGGGPRYSIAICLPSFPELSMQVVLAWGRLSDYPKRLDYDSNTVSNHVPTAITAPSLSHRNTSCLQSIINRTYLQSEKTFTALRYQRSATTTETVESRHIHTTTRGKMLCTSFRYLLWDLLLAAYTHALHNTFARSRAQAHTHTHDCDQTVSQLLILDLWKSWGGNLRYLRSKFFFSIWLVVYSHHNLGTIRLEYKKQLLPISTLLKYRVCIYTDMCNQTFDDSAHVWQLDDREKRWRANARGVLVWLNVAAPWRCVDRQKRSGGELVKCQKRNIATYLKRRNH